MSDEFILNRNTLQKILLINNSIQNQKAKLSLDGKGVICVALDGTCSFDDVQVSEIKLTNTQLDELVVHAIELAISRSNNPCKD